MMQPPLDPRWEEGIQNRARAFVYPPTPDIARTVQTRLAAVAPIPSRRQLRLAWAILLALVILLTGLFAVPPIRAALLEWLQIGAVRIWLVEPTPTSQMLTHTPVATEVVRIADSVVTAVPPLINFTGKTTLANAQAQLDFPLRLPTASFVSGVPDHLFVQETNGRFVVLIWMEPQDPARVRLILYEIGPGVGLAKTAPQVLRQTSVHGRPAAWVEGIHYLEHATQGWGERRLIDQDVLVWREEVAGQEITYRLESTLSEAQAIQLAESLR